MLHYRIDNEIMADMYKDFCAITEPVFEQLNELGRLYQTLKEIYELDEKTVYAMDLMAKARTLAQLDELETKLVHGYVTAKGSVRAEQAEYKEFAMSFEGETERALLNLMEYVVGKKHIPYKIKNRNLTIQVISTQAMVQELCFENVLIEDGRHPREILITHLAGESFKDEDCGDDEPEKYRLSFVNGLSDGPYQTNASSFVFTGVKGRLKFYDYHSFCSEIDVNADKLPWRILMDSMDGLMSKARVLGVESLNDNEMAALPFLCVFYELIEFYLEPSTQAGVGRNLLKYDDDLAAGFAFSEVDIQGACSYLEAYGLNLTQLLSKAISDRAAFCRYWIQYISTKGGEELYKILMDTLRRCGESYERCPMPIAYEKYSGLVKRVLSDYFGKNKWRGEFPCYYKAVPSKFLEVSNVCDKMYTYLNENQKGFYIDFIEGINSSTYSIMAVAGYHILPAGTNPKDYRALYGYFLDGGRRFSRVVGQIEITHGMDKKEIAHILRAMISDAIDGFDGL